MRRALSRRAALSCVGVPPELAQLPGASTAKQQQHAHMKPEMIMTRGKWRRCGLIRKDVDNKENQVGFNVLPTYTVSVPSLIID